MKNANAVALGRLGGLVGGPARAAKLSPERRSEIARRAVTARWCLEKRLKRIAKARELAAELGIDVGVAEGTLLALERSPSERLARGLMKGRWAKVGT
jgi:DNA-directed RNA polymerase specialized sigma subunit